MIGWIGKHSGMLKIYGVEATSRRYIYIKKKKKLYRETNAYEKVDGELSDCSVIWVGVRQGCVMSPWLCNIFMDRCLREMKAKAGKIGGRLNLNGVDWLMVACLFTDDTVLQGESEMTLQRVVDQFHSVCVEGS